MLMQENKNGMTHVKYFYRYRAGRYDVTVAEKDGKITDTFFGADSVEGAVEKETPLLFMAGNQLKEYFAGERKKFSLPLQPEGTPFQKKVWDALLTIPYGETRSYKEIAIQIGNEKACRAVGMANHNNPVGIVIPCHRVVGSSGKLTGYAGGLDKKEYLLELERKNR